MCFPSASINKSTALIFFDASHVPHLEIFQSTFHSEKVGDPFHTSLSVVDLRQSYTDIGYSANR